MADARDVPPRIGGQRNDRRIARLAVGQHGVVSRDQLRRLGLSAREIEGRLERGTLHLLHRGVYGVGHPSLSLQGRWMAAVLTGGRGAALSHQAAAWLWRIRSSGPSWIDVTVPSQRRPRPSLRFHRTTLPPDEITVRNGIPVTTVPRTLLDLASVIAPDHLERAAHEVEVLGLTDTLSLPDLMARHRRRSGTANLRRALAAPPRITRSELERRFLHLLQVHRLPQPNVNALVSGVEVDCAWPRQHLIVELDGRAVHDTARAFESDRERDRLLMLDGWRVARFTWRQVTERPAEVASQTRGLLALHHRPAALPSST